MLESKKQGKPWFKKPSLTVSSRMKKVHSVGTKLEDAMETIFKANKVRFVRQPDLFGKPDFLVKGTEILVFCDSSFWHGRRAKDLKGEAFKKNKDFWVTKLNENRKRDRRINGQLKRDGWRVLRFWDTDILRKPADVTRKLKGAIEENGG